MMKSAGTVIPLRVTVLTITPPLAVVANFVSEKVNAAVKLVWLPVGAGKVSVALTLYPAQHGIAASNSNASRVTAGTQT
jgi:hypothetical protein